MASAELGAAMADLQAALVLPEPDEAFDGEAWNDAFQAALDRVLALNDPTAVEGLLSLLDDDYELQDVLWSLMHGAERFPLEPYLAGLIAVVPRLAMTAPGWARRLTGRVLNSKAHRAALADTLADSDPRTKAAFREIFAALLKESTDQFEASVEWISAKIG